MLAVIYAFLRKFGNILQKTLKNSRILFISLVLVSAQMNIVANTDTEKMNNERDADVLSKR